METIIEAPTTLDILDTHFPALSSTSDMPVIETKPDAVGAPIVPAAEAASPEEADETSTESATVATEEQSGADDTTVKKPPRGVQKRLDELTKQREDAERRAERLLAIVEGYKQAPQPDVQAPPEVVRPSREDFATPEQYESAFMDFAVKQAEASAERKVEAMTNAREMESAMQAARESYAKRIATAKAKYADFSEVAESPDVIIPMGVVHAIVASDDGPDLQYYFGKNPDEAKRLLSLPPPMQLLELGKISMKLSSPSTPKPSLSNAPPPPKALKPGPAETPVDPQTESMEAYVVRRRKEMAANAHH